jgi:hypothetical protein
MAWCVDVCWRYDVWMDNCQGSQGWAGSRIWSIVAFCRLITKSISSPLLVIFVLWSCCWQFQLLLCCQCVLELVVVDGRVLQVWVVKLKLLACSGKVHPVLLLLWKQQQDWGWCMWYEWLHSVELGLLLVGYCQGRSNHQHGCELLEQRVMTRQSEHWESCQRDCTV